MQLSGGELAALRRNAEEQEVLLRGYQVENEAAVTKIKVRGGGEGGRGRRGRGPGGRGRRAGRSTVLDESRQCVPV